MSKGLPNIEIEKLFKEINNDDLNENLLGVYPSGKINKFIMFDKMMVGKDNPFFVSNTDRSDQAGMHWESVINISPKNELFLTCME